MSRKLLYCGLDVDDQAFHAFLISSDGEYFSFKTSPTFKHLNEKLKEYAKKCQVKICYEASYLSFSLCRTLRSAGYDCEVISPSHIPQIAGDRVKTDKKDAKKLATYFMQGLLKTVHVPDEEDEAIRNLIRSRANSVQQMASLKNYIQACCRRIGLDYKKETNKTEYWTKVHRDWIKKKIEGLENLIIKFDLLNQLTLLQNFELTIERYDQEIERVAELDQFKEKIKALRCFRGINTLSAMTIVTEIGDIKRFGHPKKLVSYCGLDVAEYSSGGRENKLGITKAGNKFLRTVLVEANQVGWSKTIVSKSLQKRRSEANPESVAVADRCMERLTKKRFHLLNKNKHPNKVKVACAREMTGFIWEILQKF